jgi:hypothetical protein
MRDAIPPLPNTPSWRGAQLKHRGNFLPLPKREEVAEAGEECIMRSFITYTLHQILLG